MELSLRSRLRAGDQSALGELFDEQARDLYRYAVRASGDWAMAEDIVSLTFLEAWRLRGKLREEGESVRPWLFGIAANVLRNTARAARRHQAALARMPAREVMPDFADELVSRLDDSAELAAAHRALARLRRGEREVFTLCVWAGLDYAGAAQALGVPVGTVRSRLSRARTRLRKLAQEELAGARSRMEPGDGGGQVQGGRTEAARSMREKSR
ncbi:RNA polymerase sigma factor [Kitasatospora sp. NBC_00240]|uniref:RNA polymerase sigma factor n=1 Tax=Kitasatospora sp. NBC_00240 TaxID=2903567 RepID=UPI002256AA5B|nr:RNA polymerase sigma factor [Kitasatospora sp. NBC_00240]MCX5212641.1 RNA polymerase sigma factor [Kitasatospora sp. NBC_00240]